MLPKMQASPFVKKYSVQFVNSRGRESAPFYFWDNKPHECSQTWQVVRSEFDRMMLDNAREHGVDAREGVRVHDVLFEGDRAVGVRIKEGDGFQEVRAGVVVDVGVRAVARGSFYPVLATAAPTGLGMTEVLEVMTQAFPSPLEHEVPPVTTPDGSRLFGLVAGIPGFLLLPITGLAMVALPALDAHTRLLLGRSLAYQVTEKRPPASSERYRARRSSERPFSRAISP